MTDTTTNTKPIMKVRDLLDILAGCDPDADVSLFVPMFIAESDAAIANDSDALCGEYSFTPVVSAGFRTSKELPSGARPNHVSIMLYESDTESLIAARQRAATGDR